MRELLLELYSDERVIRLFREILKQRPQIPAYNFQKDNSEEWKARSSEQRGFDVWLTYLEINQEQDPWKTK